MQLFHEIPEGQVILRTKGVFRQSKLFRRGDRLYAAVGSGFVRLLQGGDTTVPTTSWLEIDGDDVTVERGRGPRYTGAEA